ADDLAGPRVVVGAVELLLAYLAEQAEELAAEASLRIAPRGQRSDAEPRERRGALGEVEGEGARGAWEHDRGGVRRAGDVADDPRHEHLGRHVRGAGELAQLREPVGVRRPDAVPVEGSERGAIGGDDEMPGRSGEQPAAPVDDRAARAREVDGSERLLGREP